MGKKKAERLFCKRPDRDVPGIKCGYPLPCPYHTFVVDQANDSITVPSHATPEQFPAINRVAAAIRRRGAA